MVAAIVLVPIQFAGCYSASLHEVYDYQTESSFCYAQVS